MIVWNTWKIFWAVVGPLIALAGLWFNLAPSLSVYAGVNIDQSQMYSTQIMIDNKGKTNIYDLSFECVIGPGGGSIHIDLLEMHSSDISSVKVLAPGQQVTKACARSSLVNGNNALKFVTKFRWPLLGWQDSKSVTFDIKKGPPGYFLVPGDGR